MIFLIFSDQCLHYFAVEKNCTFN